MAASSSAPFAQRIARVQDGVRAASLDALLVTHQPNIRYLTGFNGSAGVLVITLADSALIVDSRYAIAARSALARSSELVATVTALVDQDGDDAFHTFVQHRNARRIGIEGHSMSVARFNTLAAALNERAASHARAVPELVPTARFVERERAVKDAFELTTLRDAGRRLTAVAAEVPSLVREGRAEREVAAAIDDLLRHAGFERPAFETIVASGPNSALPHARPGDRRLQPADGVLLDFGGVYDGYCVDLTRTVQLGGWTPEFRRIFDAVAEAQHAAIEAIRPGVTASTVDAAARQTLVRHGLGEAFGHATGHGLGLEVHEEPRISRYTGSKPDVVLMPGMVFTVEPGAYVEGFGGVRIEDDVVVTAEGCEILTR